MNHRPIIGAAGTLLLLLSPACQQAEGNDSAGGDNLSATPPSRDIRQTSEPTAPAPAPSTAGAGLEPAGVSRQPDARTIPAPFRGRWGDTLEACRAMVEDRDGVMTVTSNELHFNEMRVVTTAVTLRSPIRVSVNAEVDEPARDFTFSTDLVLEDGGNVLVREEEGPRRRYRRCPRRAE